MIPLFKPVCGEEEIGAMARVMRSGWWGMGPEVEAFEDEFAAYTGRKYAIAVNSGTMALELAARASGQTHGIVVVPALTFVSSAQAMLHCSNKVIFADIREDDLCIDWTDAYERACEFENSDWGIVPVWYGGAVSQIPQPIEDNFTIIEDCAHAAGSKFTGRRGSAQAWSFHAVKNLATGDGGMVTTDYLDVAQTVRRLRWCGIDKSTWDRDKDARVGYGWDYNIPGDGYKAHMNDLTAAIGRVQLKYLDERNQIRRGIARMYNNQLAVCSWLRLPEVNANSSQHLYVVRIAAKERQAFIQHMIGKGVSAGVHYKPLNHYRELFPFSNPKDTPVTDRVWQTLVTLPLYPDMSNADIAVVVQAVRSFKP